MNDDPRIDAAIDSYEMVALPDGFTRRTMQRVAEVKSRQPAFRLHFIDVALPLFSVAFVTAIMLIASYALKSLKPLWYQEFLQQTISWASVLDEIQPIFIVGIGLIGVTVVLMGLLLVTLISSRPSLRLNL